MKCLCIIDDDPIYLMLAKRLISIHQFSGLVLEYKNGNEAYLALKRLKDQNEKFPDIILLDINMPIWDGWDFLNEIIKLDFDNKTDIYIVSSSTGADDIQKSKRYPQIKKFLTKPLKIEDIQSILK